MTTNFLNKLATMNNEELVNFCLLKKIIKSNRLCTTCMHDMCLVVCKNNKIGRCWECPNKNCQKYKNTISIFTDSFFSGRRNDPRSVLQILYYLAQNCLLTEIVKFTGCKYDTVAGIKSAVQEKINLYWNNNPIKLGGLGINVQVDETKLNFNVKSHRGRAPVAAYWAITITDNSTTPAIGWAEIVENRNISTLHPIINRVVLPGSKIVTDQWAAYNGLSNMNDYQHLTVCHKYNFVDPTTLAHTQNVESFNNKIKLEIKKRKGIINVRKDDFLKFFLFHDHYKMNTFTKLLELLNID